MGVTIRRGSSMKRGYGEARYLSDSDRGKSFRRGSSVKWGVLTGGFLSEEGAQFQCSYSRAETVRAPPSVAATL